MARSLVPGKGKPEVRRVDPQYRVGLTDDAIDALGVEPDDYVFFAIVNGKVEIRKVRLD